MLNLILFSSNNIQTFTPTIHLEHKPSTCFMIVCIYFGTERENRDCPYLAGESDGHRLIIL